MSAAACISSFPPPPMAAAAAPAPETTIDVFVVANHTPVTAAADKSSCEGDVVAGGGRTVRRPRAVARTLECERRVVGEGFAVRRGIGRKELDSLDPFISLDEFEFSPPAGFHDHPHRGFENVTYMLEGGFSYHDFSGHKGTINTGDVQWMTAGRGVVHAEMPGGHGVQRGINLWINLSSKDKMVEPRYQELASHDIPAVERDGVSVKVIAGEALGARSPLQTRTPALCLDVAMRPGARLRAPVPPGWSACSYVIDGEAVFGDEAAAAGAHTCVVFGGGGDGVAARATERSAARFLLVAARPHGEAVVKDGPFVMNTREEVEQARDDYRNRRNGFEMAAGWSSDHVATAAAAH
ncbi:pirin-like protein isoform X1 [Oryza glaberrima]|uniref:Pirin N-terminal domain-containing protein n=1 Tax=Oryza glaberrima TaxID=4538 RepID=I1QI35_ORYGL|nr:pirin-like protein isoform X1 [Oryza glaberrima]